MHKIVCIQSSVFKLPVDFFITLEDLRFHPFRPLNKTCVEKDMYNAPKSVRDPVPSMRGKKGDQFFTIRKSSVKKTTRNRLKAQPVV